MTYMLVPALLVVPSVLVLVTLRNSMAPWPRPVPIEARRHLSARPGR